jgi:glutathione peroxidase
MSIYQFKAKNNKGEVVSLENYKGKVILIVNTASKCGFTPQYAELEQLYKKHSESLAVLAFPCNQFGSQEPGQAEEIKEFCDLQFNISFDLFDKVEVNGKDTHELYQYLKKEQKGLLGSEKIKWNFTKFLVDTKGNVVNRYAPQTKPLSIEEDIKALL